MSDVVVVAPHPDDAEIGCGATLAMAARRGQDVLVVDLTAGELSSNGDPATRAAEAAAAARVLGVRRQCLGLPDRGIGSDPGHSRSLAALLRSERPRLVLGPRDDDPHPDHRAAAMLTAAAVFDAGLGRLHLAGLPAHRVSAVWYYAVRGDWSPSFLLDASDGHDAKVAALGCYKSQFGAGQVATPLNRGFVAALCGRDAWWGSLVGVAFAEGFGGPRPPLLSGWPT